MEARERKIEEYGIDFSHCTFRPLFRSQDNAPPCNQTATKEIFFVAQSRENYSISVCESCAFTFTVLAEDPDFGVRVTDITPVAKARNLFVNSSFPILPPVINP